MATKLVNFALTVSFIAQRFFNVLIQSQYFGKILKELSSSFLSNFDEMWPTILPLCKVTTPSWNIKDFLQIYFTFF